MKKNYRLLITLLLLFAIFVKCSSAPAGYFIPKEKSAEIRIRVTGIVKIEGFIMLALHYNKENFISGNMPAIAVKKKITGSEMSFVFPGNYNPGSYAVAVFHDEDSNGKLEMNKYGIPLEGFGFSKNPSLAKGRPGWENSVFRVNEKVHEETIRMLYAMSGGN